jgi:hypothetical protein
VLLLNNLEFPKFSFALTAERKESDFLAHTEQLLHCFKRKISMNHNPDRLIK